MKTLFIAGHGAWDISNGYTCVPRGCSISFYTEFSKSMFSRDMIEIMSGTYRGTIQQRVEEYKACPNYTIHPDPDKYQGSHYIVNQRGNNYRLLMNGGGPPTTLSEIFYGLSQNNIQLDMVFCTCRNTMLKDRGGRSVGFNAAQGTWGDRNSSGQLVLSGGDPDKLFFFRLTNALVKNL